MMRTSKLKNVRIKNIAIAVASVVYMWILVKGLSCNRSSNNATVHNAKHHWQMVTTWSNNLPLLQSNIEKMAKEIETSTDGQISIQFVNQFQSNNAQTVQVASCKPIELLHAVSDGKIQMLHSAAYYWQEEIPAAVYFSAVPFGLQHNEVKQWLENGGMGLWKNLYAHYGIQTIPFSCGHTGNQMAGWFKKEINSTEDLRYLRMRIAGLGGEIMKNCFDVSPVSLLPSEIFKEMEKGTLDAAEWIGPYDDYRLGLHTLNAFYYEPGWQEPNTMFELSLNKAAFESLSENLQNKVRSVIEKYDMKIYQDYMDQNQSFRKILKEKMNIQFRRFNRDIMNQLYNCSMQTLAQYNQADQSGFSQKIYDSYIQFKGKTEW